MGYHFTRRLHKPTRSRLLCKLVRHRTVRRAGNPAGNEDGRYDIPVSLRASSSAANNGVCLSSQPVHRCRQSSVRSVIADRPSRLNFCQAPITVPTAKRRQLLVGIGLLYPAS